MTDYFDLCLYEDKQDTKADWWCKPVFSISGQLKYHHLLLSLKQSRGNGDTPTILIMCESYFVEISEKCKQQQCVIYNEASL